MHALALVFTLHFGRAGGTAGDAWLSRDKAKHFFMSAFVQSASFSALRTTRLSRNGSLIGATIVSAGVGVGKELYDQRYGGDPSLKDLAADGAGILAATALLRHTER
jgi:putative lipoprotein